MEGLENYQRHKAGDFGCDIFLGVFDVPLNKYVNSRQPTNEVMKLEGQNVDVSLLTFVDDVMDILIQSTPGSAKPRGPDASNIPPRRVAQSPPKNRGKRGKGLLTQQALLGVFGFEAQGDRGQKRGVAGSGRGAGARGGRGAGSKSLPKSEPSKRQTSLHGSKKSDISSWFSKRAFSYQSGQGGPAATDHHRDTGQALRHCEQAIDHQTEGDVGANAQKVHEPGTSSHGDCSVRVVQDQEI